MADWQALKAAESLCQESKELNNAIDREIEKMENTIRTAQDSLSLIDRLSDQTLTYIEYLAKEIIETQKMAKRHVMKMQLIKDRETEIQSGKIMPFLLSRPKMIPSDLETYHELPKPVIESPNLNLNMSAAIKQSPISSLQANLEHWDTIAAEFETFDEQFNKAYNLLKQTEKTLEKALHESSYKEQLPKIKTRQSQKRKRINP